MVVFRCDVSGPSLPAPSRPSTFTAFLKGEQTTGMTKQCYYDGLGSGESFAAFASSPRERAVSQANV